VAGQMGGGYVCERLAAGMAEDASVTVHRGHPTDRREHRRPVVQPADGYAPVLDRHHAVHLRGDGDLQL